MKKLLSLLCVLSLSAALLAGCSTAGMPAPRKRLVRAVRPPR